VSYGVLIAVTDDYHRTRFFWNTSTNLPDYTASHSRRCWPLTLTPLTWRIWWAPTNASRWQIGFNSAFKGLNMLFTIYDWLFMLLWALHVLFCSILHISYWMFHNVLNDLTSCWQSIAFH